MIDTARKHGVYPLDPEMVKRYKTHNYITKFWRVKLMGGINEKKY